MNTVLTSEMANAIAQARKELPSSQDNTPQNTDQAARALYTRLQAEFTKALKDAKAQDKKLAVVMATGREAHNPGSLMAQLMLLKIAKDNGVTSLTAEAPNRMLNMRRDALATNRENPGDFSYVLGAADKKNFTIIPLPDDRRTQEERVLSTIKDAPDNCLCSMGTKSVDHVLSNKDDAQKSGDKHIVIFDLANTLGSDQAVRFPTGASFKNISNSQILSLTAQVTGQPELDTMISVAAPDPRWQAMTEKLKEQNTSFVMRTNAPAQALLSPLMTKALQAAASKDARGFKQTIEKLLEATDDKSLHEYRTGNEFAGFKTTLETLKTDAGKIIDAVPEISAPKTPTIPQPGQSKKNGR